MVSPAHLHRLSLSPTPLLDAEIPDEGEQVGEMVSLAHPRHSCLFLVPSAQLWLHSWMSPCHSRATTGARLPGRTPRSMRTSCMESNQPSVPAQCGPMGASYTLVQPKTSSQVTKTGINHLKHLHFHPPPPRSPFSPAPASLQFIGTLQELGSQPSPGGKRGERGSSPPSQLINSHQLMR